MRTLLTGGNGMLGRAISGAWRATADSDDLVIATRADADLRDEEATAAMIEAVAPDLIVHTAARVGGIAANIADPSGFLMDNLRIDANVLSGARAAGVRKLLYFGSSCMYPRDHRQPLRESDVLAGPLEPTNEGYALSKIAAARYCEYVATQFGDDFRVLIPSNLYGPHDDFSTDRSHLVAATLRKAHEAKRTGAQEIDVWGDGTARREFTYVEDLAAWVVSNLRDLPQWPTLMNIGAGDDHSVLEYYEAALRVVGYDCELVTDPTRPAGMAQKLMDSSRAKQWGWSPSTTLEQGMRATYAAFLSSSPS